MHFGTGTGSFENPLSLSVESQVGRIATGDFNEDGVLDLAVTSNWGEQLISF